MGCASVGSNRRFDNCCLRSFSGNEIWSHVGQTNLGDASLFVQLNNSVRFSTNRFISVCWYTLYTYATETVAYLIASTPLLNIEAKQESRQESDLRLLSLSWLKIPRCHLH